MIKTREGYKFYTKEDIEKRATELAMKYILDGYKMSVALNGRGGFCLTKGNHYVHITFEDIDFVGGDSPSWGWFLKVAEITTDSTSPSISNSRYRTVDAWFCFDSNSPTRGCGLFVADITLAEELNDKRLRRYANRVCNPTTKYISGDKVKSIMPWINKLNGCKTLKPSEVTVSINRNDRYVYYHIFNARHDEPKLIWSKAVALNNRKDK